MSGLLVAAAVALTLALSQRERGQSPTHGCQLHCSLSLWERAGVRATASQAHPQQEHCMSLTTAHLHPNDSLSPWESAGVRATASHANPLQRTIA
jgi:hypothetical protein